MNPFSILLSRGNKITQFKDPLSKISIQQLFNYITDNEELKKISLPIRNLYLLDKTSYNKMKKELPYVVPSIFHPPYRSSENFGYSQLLILDIDHISQTQKNIQEIIQSIKNDPRILLFFTSPSGDGLKIFFYLKDRCSSKEVYSQFYKQFSLQFANQYNLLTTIDKSTSDVTRACFLCHDPHAYLNTNNPEPLSINLDSILQHITTINNTPSNPNDSSNNNNNNNPPLQTNHQDIPKEIYDEIRKTLNPKNFLKEQNKQKNVYITQKLKELDPIIHSKLSSLPHIQTFNIRPISYALQISITIQNKIGEINLFHGKKGFSIVISTKSNTDLNTSLLLKQILNDILSNLP